MTPGQKETLLGWIFALTGAFLSSLIILGMTGCAHRLQATNRSEEDAQAAIFSTMTLSQKIEAESRYLESH